MEKKKEEIKTFEKKTNKKLRSSNFSTGAVRDNIWHGFIDLRFTLLSKIFHVKSKYYYSYLHENKIMFL